MVRQASKARSGVGREMVMKFKVNILGRTYEVKSDDYDKAMHSNPNHHGAHRGSLQLIFLKTEGIVDPEIVHTEFIKDTFILNVELSEEQWSLENHWKQSNFLEE